MGSREGADLQSVYDFAVALHDKHPDTIVISGGADGVDKWIEKNWLLLGGMVESYRVKQLGRKEFGVELWELGGHTPVVWILPGHPTLANRRSALLYRDLVVAEKCDRLVAFFRPGRSRGTAFTLEMTEHYGKPTHVYERGVIAA